MMNPYERQEMMDQFNAQFDDNRERFAATLADMELYARSEEEAAREEYEAWVATPEGKAEVAANEAARLARKVEEAARWAAEDADPNALPF